MRISYSSVLPIFPILASSLVYAVNACKSNEDCSLNGVCDTHHKTCTCDPGWTAADCGKLDLKPATRGTGYNKTASGTSSWCNVIKHDPKDKSLWHLFVSEFQDGCGLDFWSPFSRIIRAESRHGPEGPYEFAAQVAPSFAHNPSVVWSPADKLYLIYGIGCHQNLPATCTPPEFTCGPGNFINGESGISLWSSPDLYTWTSHGQIFKGDNGGNWDADLTNPSPLPLYSSNDHTDTILLAYRGCPYNCSGSEQINLAEAPHFLGPYHKLEKNPIFPNPNEDPFIWRDKRGHYHMLSHSLEPLGGFGSGPNVGRHAYSKDIDGPWHFNNNTLAFSTLVDFTDGSSTNYYRRERPNLYFSEDGKMVPLFLGTGVQEVNSSMSYSLIQPVGSSGSGYKE
ncbi:hypothetical protein NA57DRAFT_73890 [Rhizodiscina lignyota]|uniref:EGF-like domain-containing protein n=1 Tax=Rhizodiscina lignyota TaxID=1504668 RepID=A0A9P4IJ64_9PEZI|nr:hypothetical protein NA57DRAFT_73890 [Rhizodiscina lignyota]